MKKGFLIIVSLAIALAVHGQDCSSAEDCLNKGKASKFENQAIELFSKGIKLAKKEGYNSSQLYLNRGMKYYRLYTPNYKDAEKDFKSAIKEDEKNIWAYLWLSNIYAYGEKDYKKSTGYLTELLNAFPNEPKVLRERANIHRYYNNNPLAATDFEMAYNLIMDDPKLTDEWTAAEIVRWHAETYMRSKSIIIADAATVKILEGGLKAAPNDAKLLGDLALAYFDTKQEDKAYEYGAKAHAINKSTVGSAFVAIKALENKEYRVASSLMWEADRALIHSHPLIYYYFATANWAYCYHVAKNQWEANVGIIKNRLELAVQHGAGTTYDWYAQESKRQLASLK